MKAVLGIWDGHDASVALVAGGELLFALSEERPTRIQRYSGFPYLALEQCLQWADKHQITVEDVALAGRIGRAPLRAFDRMYSRRDPHRDPLAPSSRLVQAWENSIGTVPGLRAIERSIGLAFARKRITRMVGKDFWLHAVDHHDAHAFSALFGPDRESALVVTLDAYGEGRAATVRLADDPTNLLFEAGPAMGVASLYGAVTECMGFREGEEGKVMGLAAHGRRDLVVRRFMDLFEDLEGTPLLKARLTRSRVEATLHGLTAEDAAAGLQACTERLTSRWITQLIRDQPGTERLLLAGGLFANVRVNQILSQLNGVQGLYVFPNMGDGGLAAGAAHYVWHKMTKTLANPLRHVYLGCEFDRHSMIEAARSQGLGCARVGSPDVAAAEYIRKGRVVCRFSGREEFGPRALGNRSILFSAARPGMTQRVNQALGRDDFMPFAPAIREVATGFALGGVSAGVDLGHMTVAANSTGELQSECPSAVHVDGTTRPQVVYEETAPDFHNLLTEHRGFGGRRAVINTSFNLHGEPIVHTPDNAVASFLKSGLDVLLMGDIEVRRKGR